MHRQVRARSTSPSGPYPAGTPYRADDPELLMWVLFTLVDSALVVYGKYVRSIDRREQAALWDDYRVIGRLFGLPTATCQPDRRARPLSVRMLAGDRLYVSDWARARAREIVLRPPVP